MKQQMRTGLRRQLVLFFAALGACVPPNDATEDDRREHVWSDIKNGTVITSVRDTHIKTSTKDSSQLPPQEACAVSAKTQLTVTDPVPVGPHVRARLVFAADCDGSAKFAAGSNVYFYRPHFSGWEKETSGAPPASSSTPSSNNDSISARGVKQMKDLVNYADAHNTGASAGQCFNAVWGYMTAVGYGDIDDWNDAPEMCSGYARCFAEYMNEPSHASTWGLRRLSIDNPYDAPAGAIVVVAPGSPGTSDPYAGDITVAAGSGRFINDGPNMSYGSRDTFKSAGGRLLGAFVPK